jgi:hypothetical protein
MTQAHIKVTVEFRSKVAKTQLAPGLFRWTLDRPLSEGAGANQLTYAHAGPSSSIPGSITVPFDLQGFTDQHGDAQSFDELVCFYLNSEKTTPGTTFEVKANATNGWTALLPGAGDALQLPSGAWLFVHCSTATAYAVSGTSKALDVENTTANAGSIELCILGRQN